MRILSLLFVLFAIFAVSSGISATSTIRLDYYSDNSAGGAVCTSALGGWPNSGVLSGGDCFDIPTNLYKTYVNGALGGWASAVAFRMPSTLPTAGNTLTLELYSTSDCSTGLLSPTMNFGLSTGSCVRWDSGNSAYSAIIVLDPPTTTVAPTTTTTTAPTTTTTTTTTDTTTTTTTTTAAPTTTTTTTAAPTTTTTTAAATTTTAAATTTTAAATTTTTAAATTTTTAGPTTTTNATTGAPTTSAAGAFVNVKIQTTNCAGTIESETQYRVGTSCFQYWAGPYYLKADTCFVGPNTGSLTVYTDAACTSVLISSPIGSANCAVDGGKGVTMTCTNTQRTTTTLINNGPNLSAGSVSAAVVAILSVVVAVIVF